MVSPLGLPDDDVRRLEPSLSPEERTRGERFHFKSDRDRFVARRVARRAILGDYLALPGADLTFAEGGGGKPALTTATHEPLDFSASHSAHMAVIAVAVDRAIGIDLEQITTVVDFESIARRFFAAAEIAALERVPPGERLRLFFRYWTRKEAVVKASGEGVSRLLDSFEVSLSPDQPALLVVGIGNGQEHEWTLREFTPKPGFVGVVAARGADWTLRHRAWKLPPHR